MFHPTTRLGTCSALIAAAAIGSCASTPKAAAPQSPAQPAAAAEHYALHNVIHVTDKLFSGSIPEGDDGFDELASLGVRTIVSVDGAAPDLERAKARGMRYVHMPIGYNGLTTDRQKEIARAIRDLPGPVYVHCHHGKHRGPAAAAAAAVVLGELTAEEGIAFMKRAGTAPSYAGLYRCVETAQPTDPETLGAIPIVFHEIAPLPGFIHAMAEAQEKCDNLALIRDAGWSVPRTHPDLVPLAEAGGLENLMRALQSDPYANDKPADFAELTRASLLAVQDFERALEANAPHELLSRLLGAVNTSCKDCHVKYRDNAPVN